MNVSKLNTNDILDKLKKEDQEVKKLQDEEEFSNIRLVNPKGKIQTVRFDIFR